MKSPLLTAVCFSAFCQLVSFTPAQELPFQDKILPALFDRRVQAELELSDRQSETINSLFEEVRDKQKAAGTTLREFSRTGKDKKKIEAERREEMKKLQRKYVDELLKELSAKQRRKYLEMIGDKVDF